MAVLSLLVTVAIYLGSRWLYRRRPRVLLNPIFVSPLLISTGLLIGRIDYGDYLAAGAQWLSFLLGPATVALAVPMYRNRHLLRRYGLELGAGVILGAAVALVTSVGPVVWLGWDWELAVSLAPRSVTTPIAMEFARTYGGEPVMAAVFVIATALVGIVVGPLLIRWLRIRSAVARGALFGVGAHGIGTARAFEFGETEGTVSGVAMILTAFATLALAPFILPLFHPGA